MGRGGAGSALNGYAHPTDHPRARRLPDPGQRGRGAALDLRRGDVPIDGAGVIETQLNWIKLNYIPLRIEQFTAHEESSLKLEWRTPGSEDFVPIPGEFWRSISDPTRVISPGHAEGRYGGQTGNSGVYLQGRYEIQVLATPADKPVDEMELGEAGSLYKAKGPT